MNLFAKLGLPIGPWELAEPEPGAEALHDLRPRVEMYGVTIRVPPFKYLHKPAYSKKLARAEAEACFAGELVTDRMDGPLRDRLGRWFEEDYANYGPRVAHQLYPIARLLAESPCTRQAVIHLNSVPHPQGLIPLPEMSCVESLQYIRPGGGQKLVSVVIMRSSDLYMGLPYDTHLLSHLLQFMSSQLGTQSLGTTLQIGNAHVYLDDLNRAEKEDFEWRDCQTYV